MIQLKATGATLIWASTTLVPEGEVGRVAGDDKIYNEAATRVMQKHGVAINDLHALSASLDPNLFIRPGDVHFTTEGSKNSRNRWWPRFPRCWMGKMTFVKTTPCAWRNIV